LLVRFNDEISTPVALKLAYDVGTIYKLLTLEEIST
jgi:hypothetical protein